MRVDCSDAWSYRSPHFASKNWLNFLRFFPTLIRSQVSILVGAPRTQKSLYFPLVRLRVVIVVVKDEKVAQFSHFSVREYLMSNRIANSAPVSHFHVLPKFSQTGTYSSRQRAVCLGVLLQLDHGIDVR